MSYQLKKVRLLSYKLHAAFTPSAHFRPKKAPRAKFSRGGGRVYFGVNGQFLCLGGPSYGHWKTMRVVLKNFFDLTPLSPYPTEGIKTNKENYRKVKVDELNLSTTIQNFDFQHAAKNAKSKASGQESITSH